MDCTDFSARLDEWVDGSLAADGGDLMELHAAACQGCRRALRERRLVKRVVLAKFRRPEPSTLFSSALASQLALAARPRARLWALAVGGGVAASIGGLVLFIFFFLPGFEPRLTHADVAFGSVEAFHTCCTSNPPPGSGGREVCKRTLCQQLRLEQGPEFEGLVSLRNAQFQGWAIQKVRGVSVVRVDYKPTAEGEQGPGASLNCKDPVVSVFLIPMASTRFSPDLVERLERGHPCTRCARMSDGSLYCITSQGYLKVIISNLSEAALLQNHVGE